MTLGVGTVGFSDGDGVGLLNALVKGGGGGRGFDEGIG